jgi:hypothetical protein
MTAAHAGTAHAGGPHAGPGHGDGGHGLSSHAMHAAPAYRHETAVQPRHDAGYSHPAPAYRAPPREMSQPFRAEPQHFASPRPGPGREGPPHGAQGGRPH